MVGPPSTGRPNEKGERAGTATYKAAKSRRRNVFILPLNHVITPVMTQHTDINSIRPWRTIERRKSRQIMVGKVPVGGDAPIAVQSMTNTVTHDVAGTIEQIRGLEIAGADIVRVSVPCLLYTSPSPRDS